MLDSPLPVPSESQSSRGRLVAALQANGCLHSPNVAQAFLQVPREAFVSSFHQREAEPGMVWTLHDAADVSPQQWLDQVYQDEPLVTKLDERKWPISSSSAPSVMARMLEALDIQPGNRVLEIGTGSGYNAALIAHLTGDPALVTTVELDATMAERAERMLQTLVGPVSVQTGDGRSGAAAHAPYQKIIATASAGYIPRAWYEQLASGGRLVMDLQGKQASSGFLVVEKARDGMAAKGTFWQPPLCFMPLIDPQTPVERVGSLFDLPCAQEIVVEPESAFPALFQEPAFRWFLQWFYPTLTVTQPFLVPKRTSKAIVLKDASHETILQLNQQDEGGWQGKQRGAYPLWRHVEQASECFVEQHRPGQERYAVVLESQRARLMLTERSENASLVLCDLYSG